MYAPNPICMMKAVFRTVMSGIYISGHDYIEKGIYHRNGRYEQVLVCKICGHKSIAWSNNVSIFNSKIEVKK